MLKMLKQIWEVVSNADTLKSLWDQRIFIGSFVLGGLGTFWAWIQDQPSSIIFTVGVVLFFVVYLVSVITKAVNEEKRNKTSTEENKSDKQFPLANLDEWRKTDPLLLWQAGCLWNGISPRYPVTFDNPSYAVFSRLLRAAEHGELELIKQEPDLAISHVARQALYDYAKKKNDVPEFLKDMEGVNHRELGGSSKHDVWLLYAVHYTVFRNWDARKINLSDSQELNELYDNQKQIRQLASDGDLPIWGMNNFSGPLILIEPDYWQRYDFEFMGALKHTDHPEEWKTENARPPNDLSIYHSLKTSKEFIEKYFPTDQQEFEQAFNDTMDNK
jgi:hypothetical protein